MDQTFEKAVAGPKPKAIGKVAKVIPNFFKPLLVDLKYKDQGNAPTKNTL